MAKNTAPKSETASETKTTAQVVMIKALSVNKSFPKADINEEIVFSGTVSKVTTEQSKYGDYQKFSGMIFAKHNGVTVGATVAYFPEIAETLLASAFEKGDGKPVDFNFALTKIKDDRKDSKTGYSWAVVSKGESADAAARYIALLG